MTDRKKPNWPLWTIAALLLPPALYVASFGPAMWVAKLAMAYGLAPNSPLIARLSLAYSPIFRLISDGPETIGDVLLWYGNAF
jgi:hypothetical protein